jgi:hypothetical protein
MSGEFRVDQHRFTRVLLFVCLIVSVWSVFVALAAARSWPLVGDASLMRYVVFLLQRGHTPYAQIVDINLPGSYLLEAAAMKLLGGGATGLRLYDGLLGLVICLCSATLARGVKAHCCGLIAGLLLVLIHLRDGLVQAGQRDYAILAIILVAYVVFLRRPLARSALGVGLFGLLVGVAMIVKPTVIFLLLLPPFACSLNKARWQVTLRTGLLAAGAALVPVVGMLVWLYRSKALPAFVQMLGLDATSHRGLAEKTLGFLLVHSVEPVSVLFLICILLLGMQKCILSEENKLLLFGAFCGLASFVAQGKGFAYQRYPFLGLILLVMFGVLAKGLESSRLEQLVAAGALAFTCFWWMPHFAQTVRSYDHEAPFQQALAGSLTSLHAVDDQVQCLDTVGGCVNVLYDLRLVQSTGYLYDCYAYVGRPAAQSAYRNAFLDQIEVRKPRYMVLTSEFCLAAQGDPGRVARWPGLASLLARDYREGPTWKPTQLVRWWNQPEEPSSYTIFVRK